MVKRKGQFLILTLIGVFNTLCTLATSVLIMKLTDAVNSRHLSALTKAAYQLGIIALLMFLSFLLYNKFRNHFIKAELADVKSFVLQRLLQQTMGQYYKSNTDEILSFMFKDLDYLYDKYYGNLIKLVQLSIQFLLSVATIIIIYPYYIIVVFIVSLLSLIIPLIFMKKVRRISSSVSAKTKRNMNRIRNLLNGFFVIRMFSIEDRAYQKGKELIVDLQETEGQMNMLSSYIESLLMLLLQILIIISFVLGGVLVVNQQLTLGGLFALIQLVTYASNPVMGIASSWSGIQSTKHIRTRYFEFVQSTDDLKEIANMNDIKKPSIAPLELRNFSFGYQEDKPIFKNFNYEFKRGFFYLLKGSNGSGKSTLLNAMTGKLTDYTGEILYYGVERKQLSDQQIFKLISYVEQEVYIANNSVIDNLTLSSNAQERVEALKIGNELSLRTEEKEESNLDLQDRLSGGERKKIALSRVLARETPILFVDEGDSDLDVHAAEVYRNLLDKQERDLVIMISHRINDWEKKAVVIDLDQIE